MKASSFVFFLSGGLLYNAAAARLYSIHLENKWMKKIKRIRNEVSEANSSCTENPTIPSLVHLFLFLMEQRKHNVGTAIRK
jgi:hypothetical protein